jgi:hypothetical protein
MPLHVSSIKLVKYRDKFTEMHDQQNVKKNTTTCFGGVCRPSSGCRNNILNDYTICVVILEGGRDLVLHHKSWDK